MASWSHFAPKPHGSELSELAEMKPWFASEWHRPRAERDWPHLRVIYKVNDSCIFCRRRLQLQFYPNIILSPEPRLIQKGLTSRTKCSSVIDLHSESDNFIFFKLIVSFFFQAVSCKNPWTGTFKEKTFDYKACRRLTSSKFWSVRIFWRHFGFSCIVPSPTLRSSSNIADFNMITVRGTILRGKLNWFLAFFRAEGKNLISNMLQSSFSSELNLSLFISDLIMIYFCLGIVCRWWRVYLLNLK